jgi:16S rRNA G966 N2-methylase RsmD
MSKPASTKRAIEEYFPIVEINRLAVPERNAFKPIYQMHKWFARRASCVFRAILLGCLKPAATDIMAEFYKDHTRDPDTNGKLILDPFMGGGTTVVEALRLGCKVVGIDLNPVAWFIVKTEVEPVDISALKDAFERLANRKVEWSGKSVRDTLLEQYKTECPCCHGEADIIYTFWVKSAICHNEKCPARSGNRGPEVPLFSDYIVAQKKPCIRYWRDVRCPKCNKTFDWETEPATLIADPKLMFNDPTTGAGEPRGKVRWACSAGQSVICPWCQEDVKPMPTKTAKREKKKIQLNVLLCPHCESVWQWRGELPESVDCPSCKKTYKPHEGTLPDAYDFVCPSCGTKEGILASLRRLLPEERRRFKAFGIEGYCPSCARPDHEDEAATLFEKRGGKKAPAPAASHPCYLVKSDGKFVKRVEAADIARYRKACASWERRKDRLPYPRQEIPFGYQTVKGNDLPGHGFAFWHQLFNPRQLLCLSTLLAAMDEESDEVLKDMLLSGFFQLVRNQCLLCFYNAQAGKLEPALSRKDFAPPKTPCENSVWGTEYGRGTFTGIIDKIIAGKEFCWKPVDRRVKDYNPNGDPALEDAPRNERIAAEPGNPRLEAQSALHLETLGLRDKLDFVVTDPPYADNVNYSEVADFFYVWLHLVLGRKYSAFAPEFTPKAEEIIAQEVRGRSMEDFERDLTDAFKKAGGLLKDDGLLVFTFHHEANAAWEAVLESVLNAGFTVEAAYPYESDAPKSGSMGAQKIAYDVIHVCKKRDPDAKAEQRSWAGIRQEIRRAAREEVRAIETGRYGQEPLSREDVNIVLIGKCLELYSRHYGAVIDHEGRPVELHEALNEIRSLVDDLVSKEHPLPAELEDIDAESRIYLLTLCDRKEVKSDEVHKATRGVLEPDDLIESGLMVKGRAKRGRTYEVKQPAERYRDLLERLQPDGPTPQMNLPGVEAPPVVNRHVKFIDYVHLLMGLVEAGENLMPWLERFRGLTPQLRAACVYLQQRNGTFAPALQKVMGLMDPGPLFRGPTDAKGGRH